jgi:hypothetical protein
LAHGVSPTESETDQRPHFLAAADYREYPARIALFPNRFSALFPQRFSALFLLSGWRLWKTCWMLQVCHALIGIGDCFVHTPSPYACFQALQLPIHSQT